MESGLITPLALIRTGAGMGVTSNPAEFNVSIAMFNIKLQRPNEEDYFRCEARAALQIEAIISLT